MIHYEEENLQRDDDENGENQSDEDCEHFVVYEPIHKIK